MFRSIIENDIKNRSKYNSLFDKPKAFQICVLPARTPENVFDKPRAVRITVFVIDKEYAPPIRMLVFGVTVASGEYPTILRATLWKVLKGTEFLHRRNGQGKLCGATVEPLEACELSSCPFPALISPGS